MMLEEIIDSLEEQALDKDRLAGGDPESIFTSDADALREALKVLRKCKQYLDEVEGSLRIFEKGVKL